MNVLDKFRYSKDDPSQLNISLKKNPYEKVGNNNTNNLNQLLSTSVKVSKEIFPNIYSAIENVFNRLKIKNNLNFLLLPITYKPRLRVVQCPWEIVQKLY